MTIAGERRLARQDFAQDGAQAEDVAALVEVLDLAARLLGGHVRRRAQHPARRRLRGGQIVSRRCRVCVL
jgi:hypothetical protein